MLKKVNLDAKLKKSELKKLLDDKLGYELGKAQRAAREAGMPVIMVFEGWRHSRRSEIVGKMMQYMDARGFRVFTSTRVTEQERQQPLRSRRGSSLSLPRFGNDFRLRGISLFTVTAGTT